MEDAIRAPSFLIDDGLWSKLNGELRAACHWCTHHHTTTPAEAAKQLERGEGWPRDWISRKVKNSTRQFGGLFICPAQDCAGYCSNRAERRRRWFCRFCINRHLGVDLKNFFQLDEAQRKWVQVPNLPCWHCRAKNGDVICVNCPQKHSRRPKRPRLLASMPAPAMAASSMPASAVAGGDVNYDDAAAGSMQNVGDAGFCAGVPLQHSTSDADLQFLADSNHRGEYESEKAASLLPNLIEFLNNSATPFHATAEARRHLLECGFQQLRECDEWDLQAGGRYFFTRNMSSIFAFAVGRNYKPGAGFHVLAAHTDSPCPKLKPVPAVTESGFIRIRAEAYGNGLWNTWFDRDLSVAGRVLRRNENGDLSQELVRIRRPILRIPSPSFQMDRSRHVMEMGSQLAPVLATQIEADLDASYDSETSAPAGQEGHHTHHNNDVHHPLLLEVLANELGCNVNEIADFELSIYDTQPASVGGAREEFVFSGRLDNLASAFCALWALLDACSHPVDDASIQMVALFDNGEIASETGTQPVGPHTMFQAMTRIARWLSRGSLSEGIVERSIRRSFVVSADMAHALHPGNVDDTNEHNQPRLHDGLALKHNLAQNNTADAVSAFLFREVAKRNSIPTQQFTVMSDAGCCSTINSVLAAGYGVRLIDCGLPQLSMHSVREMCGTGDIDAAFRHFRAFFQHIVSLDEQLTIDG